MKEYLECLKISNDDTLWGGELCPLYLCDIHFHNFTTKRGVHPILETLTTKDLKDFRT